MIFSNQLARVSGSELAPGKESRIGCTYSPTGEWVAQQAQNLAWKLQEGKISTRFLLRERDSKFTLGFDEVFKSEDVEVIRSAYRRPVTNAYSERRA